LPAEAALLLHEIPAWKIAEGKLQREVVLKDFRSAIDFLLRVAEVAEGESHHPDFCVRYNRVEFTLYTHAIGGLSENDFILAAKIEALLN
jgi:4a-hydroxytetrahydrobiopterin dehydratase